MAVNKLDSVKQEGELWEFYQLGLGDPRPVSALHGTGTGDLLDEIVSLFPEDKVEEDVLDSINVAIIGRPMLVNHHLPISLPTIIALSYLMCRYHA